MAVAIAFSCIACDKKKAEGGHDAASPAPTPIPAAFDEKDAVPKGTNPLSEALNESRRGSAMIYVAKLNGSLLMYELINKLPPSSAQGLQALVQMPKGEPQPRKWQQIEPNIEADPWGHEYRYEYPGKHNKNGFDIFSCGPDGKPGTADDIGNW